MSETETIFQLLASPFDLSEVRFRPSVVKQNRALAIALVDARSVQDRLDAVLGVDGWQDEYTTLEDGSVVCRLRLRIGGEWITKMDVGSPSEQDGSDRLKTAFCLPLSAEALTLNGWTSYDRLSCGDMILAYDIGSARCRWTPVQDVNVFESPQSMLGLSSKSFNMACTPNHRWVIHRRDGGITMKPTDKLNSHDRIVVAAQAESGSHQLTPREAAIVGWLATDGHVGIVEDKRPGHVVPQFHAFIYQSKVIARDSIRSLLGTDAIEHIIAPGTRLFPGHDSPSATLERSAFRLSTHFARPILSRAGLYDGKTIDWSKLLGLVTRLTAESRQAIFNAMMDGDGQHSSSGQLKFGKKRKPGVMDAFEVLATLQGIALGTLHSSEESGRIPLRTLRGNPHTWYKCIEVSPMVPEPAWCPTTELGTWVTRWNSQITITGNSDALKRAAVKFGVGRYLYRLPAMWCDYDPVKKQFTKTPTLPTFAMPAKKEPPK